MTRSWMAWGALLAVFVSGCEGDKPTSEPKKSEALVMPTEQKSQGSDAAPTPAPPTPAGASKTEPVITADNSLAKAASNELKDVDMAAFEAFIAKQKGKVIVVDHWATWCVPCRAKFPKFAELSKKHGDANTVFVTVSYDAEDSVEDTREFLAQPQHQGKLTHFRMTEDLQPVVEKYDFDGLPRYFVFDADGELIVNADDLAPVENAFTKE